MQALSKNPRHMAFVYNLVLNGGNKTQAYLDAGYEPASRETARSAAFTLSTDDRIQSAFKEVGQKMLGGLTTKAMSVLERLLDDPDPAINLKAALAVANRTGHHEKSEQLITVEHTVDVAKLRERAKELSERLGLALPPGIVDAEFVEVKEPDEVTGVEGLEDLL